MEDNTAEDSVLEVRRMDRLILLNGADIIGEDIYLTRQEMIGLEYRGLDRKSAYLSGGYRIGMVQLIERRTRENMGEDWRRLHCKVL